MGAELVGLRSVDYLVLIAVALGWLVLGLALRTVGGLGLYLILTTWAVLLQPDRIARLVDLSPLAGPAGAYRLTLVEGMLVAAALVVILDGIHPAPLYRQLLALYGLLWLGVLVSSLFGVGGYSEYGWGNLLRGMLQLGEPWFGLLVWGGMIKHLGILRTLRAGLLPPLLINIIYSVWLAFVQLGLAGVATAAVRGQASSGLTPATLGMASGILLIGGLYFIYRGDRKSGALGITFGALGLVLSAALSPFLAVGLALLVVAWRVKFWLIASGMVGALLSFVYLSPSTSGLAGLLRAQLERLFFYRSVTGGINIELRFKLWERALDLFTQSPLFGHGAGLSFYLTPQYPTLRGMSHFVNFHNLILEVAAVAGLLGLVPLIILLLWLAGLILRSVLAVVPMGERYAAAAATIVLVTHQADVIMFGYKGALVASLPLVWLVVEVTKSRIALTRIHPSGRN